MLGPKVGSWIVESNELTCPVMNGANMRGTLFFNRYLNALLILFCDLAILA